MARDTTQKTAEAAADKLGIPQSERAAWVAGYVEGARTALHEIAKRQR